MVNDIKPIEDDRHEEFMTAYSLNVKRNEGLEKHRWYLMEGKNNGK